MTVVDCQVDLPLRRQVQPVKPEVVYRQPTFTTAIRLCVSLAGFEYDKVVYQELKIDAAQWSRIMRGDAHFPQDKIEQLMDFCGNDVPLMWLAYRRGKGLHDLESALERENRELKETNSKLLRDYDVIIKFMRETGIK